MKIDDPKLAELIVRGFLLESIERRNSTAPAGMAIVIKEVRQQWAQKPGGQVFLEVQVNFVNGGRAALRTNFPFEWTREHMAAGDLSTDNGSKTPVLKNNAP